MSTRMICAIAAGVTLLGAVASQAANDEKSASSVLFDTKHIVGIAAGTELVYKFERKPSDEAMLGKGFTDDIKVKVESDGADGKKTVLLQMYTGDRARDPHRITDMDGNPMLIVFLDNAVAHFRQIAGGDRAYLKNTFSSDIAKSGKLEPVTINYKGKDVAGYRVSVSPYANDPARTKMRGYEGAKFSIIVSESVPGFFAKMISDFKNSSKDGAHLEEVTTLEGVGDVK